MKMVFSVQMHAEKRYSVRFAIDRAKKSCSMARQHEGAEPPVHAPVQVKSSQVKSCSNALQPGEDQKWMDYLSLSILERRNTQGDPTSGSVVDLEDLT